LIAERRKTDGERVAKEMENKTEEPVDVEDFIQDQTANFILERGSVLSIGF